MHIHIDHAGTPRYLGNNVPIADAHLTMATRNKVYGDHPSAPMVPRSQYANLISTMGDWNVHPCLPYVHDQDGVGQCNCDATAAAVEFIRACQGLDFVKLSAGDLYGRINGGADNGSLLEDATAEMTARGIGTAATCGVLWHRGMKQAPPAERARFRVLELWLCPTFDHCMSAALSDFALISGVMWYDNFKPDGDGWLPNRGAGNAGGHAVFGYKPVMRHGEFGIAHQNSWTDKWGVGGRCVFPERMYSVGSIGGWWAIRQVVTEDGGLPPLRA